MIGKERTSSAVSASSLLMLPSATNSRNSYSMSPPPPPPHPFAGWRGSDYIFGGCVNEAEIKMSSSFSHVLVLLRNAAEDQTAAGIKLT